MTQNEEAIRSSGPSLHLEAAGLTTTGRFVTHNEDAFALYDRMYAEPAEQLGQLYLLADGRGEAGAGAVASRLAVETIVEVYYTQSDAQLPLGRLQQAFLAAHARVRAYAKTQHRNQVMTTCSALVVKGNRSWVAHLGDSRVYLIHTRPELTITRLTTDHSLSATQMRAVSRLTAEPGDQRDILLRALGVAEHQLFHPDFAIVTLRAGDALLLCSDGLWQALSEEHVAQVISQHPPKNACDLLIQQASAIGSKENISVVVLSFSEAEPRAHAECAPWHDGATG
jgi:serine/threonine protein phosphatase PrpC